MADTETGTVPNTENVTTHNAQPFTNLLTEEEVLNTIDRPFTGSAKLYADRAITIGVNSGVLRETTYSVPYQKPAIPATSVNIDQFVSWESALTAANHDENVTNLPIASSSLEPNHPFFH
ncbi:hypothetical protein EDB89DRAFT_1911057 [Lactarius sanguifluus]|nr:hypothetical protein EDB89DRAFT_1911057 [Lactarius sanguifluus]